MAVFLAVFLVVFLAAARFWPRAESAMSVAFVAVARPEETAVSAAATLAFEALADARLLACFVAARREAPFLAATFLAAAAGTSPWRSFSPSAIVMTW